MSFCGSLMALSNFGGLTEINRGVNRHPHGGLHWVKRTSGASIGALFAFAVAMRISGECLFRLLDTEAILESIVPSMNLNLLQRDYGLDDGETLRKGITRVIEVGLEIWGISVNRAPTLTFVDLQNLTGVDVLFAVTRLGSTTDSEVIETDIVKTEMLSALTTPNLSIVDALVMSMSVPILYKPCYYSSGIYVDGGLLNNTPTIQMDPDKTLVLRLKEVPHRPEEGLQDYLSSIIYAPVNWIDQCNIEKYTYCITVGSANLKTFSFQATRDMLVTGVIDGMLCTFDALAHFPVYDYSRERALDEKNQIEKEDASKVLHASS